jgi:hypothetical protein
MADGMEAIMLHHADDSATEQHVQALPAKLAADPASGIAGVLDREAIAKHGAFPDAAFLAVFKLGDSAGGALSGNLITPVPGTRGSHGFSPEFPEMRTSFFAVGASIARHRDLGVVDMRQIAPTVARILHMPPPTDKATPPDVQP